MYDFIERLRTISAAVLFAVIVVATYVGGSAALSILGPTGNLY